MVSIGIVQISTTGDHGPVAKTRQVMENKMAQQLGTDGTSEPRIH